MHALARRIEHTRLDPVTTLDDVRALVAEAQELGVVGVCVASRWVAAAKRLVDDADLLVVAVVGFPTGAHPTVVKAEEARVAVADGADELDMVADLGGIRSHDWARVQADIAAVVSVGRPVKVILETARLEHDEKREAARCAEAAGARWVKTSTGFAGGAAVPDVELLRRTVSDAVGVKASGGIRDAQQARAMVAAGADRLGCSHSRRILAAGD